MTSLRNDSGNVSCAVFAAKSGFPDDASKTVGTAIVAPSGGVATCEFSGLPAGTLGVTTVHDENANGRLDTNFLGIPTEGYGASNDARGTFGPPKWEDAMFAFDGTSLSIRVKTTY